jgi:hypothetical protein
MEVEAEEEVVEEEAPVEAWFWNYIFQICKMLKIKFFHCMKLMDFKWKFTKIEISEN